MINSLEEAATPGTVVSMHRASGASGTAFDLWGHNIQGGGR